MQSLVFTWKALYQLSLLSRSLLGILGVPQTTGSRCPLALCVSSTEDCAPCLWGINNYVSKQGTKALSFLDIFLRNSSLVIVKVCKSLGMQENDEVGNPRGHEARTSPSHHSPMNATGDIQTQGLTRVLSAL